MLSAGWIAVLMVVIAVAVGWARVRSVPKHDPFALEHGDVVELPSDARRR